MANSTEQLLQDIADADRLLITAAAGLSISEHLPNNPYHNPDHFKKQYPKVAEYGYNTCYETMGISRDKSVPEEVKKAFTARHFLNMRYDYPPTEGYEWLLELGKTFAPKEIFCWTSNVDGCFERAGFDPQSIYQTQGEMKHWQCADATGCGHVWECEEQVRKIDAAAVNGRLEDLTLCEHTACPKCGGGTLPNLRGGDWFNPKMHADRGARLNAWLDECVAKSLKVAVLEIGVGPNTPVVTSIPTAAFASAVAANGGKASYLRVNPDSPMGDKRQGLPGEGVNYYRMRSSWSALKPILDQATQRRNNAAKESTRRTKSPRREVDQGAARQWQERYTDILSSLRTQK